MDKFYKEQGGTNQSWKDSPSVRSILKITSTRERLPFEIVDGKYKIYNDLQSKEFDNIKKDRKKIDKLCNREEQKKPQVNQKIYVKCFLTPKI